MTNVAGAALLVLGVGVVIVAAPVGGAILGASMASNALLGGAAGFVAGAIVLPLPFAALMTTAAPEPQDAGKSRLFRMGKEIISLYTSIGKALFGFAADTLGKPFERKPVFVPRPDDDPFRIGHLGSDFDMAAVGTQAKPEVKSAPLQSKPQLRL